MLLLVVGVLFAEGTGQEEFDKSIEIAMNKDLPKRLDANTVLERVYYKHNIFTFISVLNGSEKVSIENIISWKDELVTLHSSQSKNQLCSNKVSLNEMKKGLEYKYEYYISDENQINFFFEFNVTYKDCEA